LRSGIHWAIFLRVSGSSVIEIVCRSGVHHHRECIRSLKTHQVNDM
jgi:hypothetical protein